MFIIVNTVLKLIFTIVGLLVPALSCLALGFVDCHTTVWAIVILVIGVSGMGFQYGGGFVLNHVDIAPKYAALLFGMSNTVATIPGFVAPIVIGALTPNVSELRYLIVRAKVNTHKIYFLKC